jgi:hypothetical protein
MFFDQLFQNVTLFAVQQANPNVYSTLFDVRTPNSTSGIGLSQAVASVGTFPVNTLADLPFGARGRFIDPNFQNPFSQHATLGAQIQLTRDMVLSLDLIHLLGLHEFAQRELNPEQDGTNDSRVLNKANGVELNGTQLYPGTPGLDAVFGCADVLGNVIPCGTISPFTNARALHRLHRITEATSDSRSRYDSMTIELKKRFANRYQIGATYVLSRALAYFGQAADFGNISQGVSKRPDGTFRTPAESSLVGIIQPQNFGYASEDTRHRFVFNGIVELPFGFIASGVLQLESPRPYFMFADDDINGDGTFTDLYSPVVTGDPTFDPLGEGDARFTARPNVLRGEPYYQTDLRVQKNTRIGEHVTIEAFGDIFNLFNRVNFGNNFRNNSDDFGAQDPGNIPIECLCNGPAVQSLPKKPLGLFGGGFGGAGTIGVPFTAQLGLRIRF